jgi:hypothetical protein
MPHLRKWQFSPETATSTADVPENADPSTKPIDAGRTIDLNRGQFASAKPSMRKSPESCSISTISSDEQTSKQDPRTISTLLGIQIDPNVEQSRNPSPGSELRRLPNSKTTNSRLLHSRKKPAGRLQIEEGIQSRTGRDELFEVDWRLNERAPVARPAQNNVFRGKPETLHSS